MINYMIHPGWIVSRNDNDQHFVGFATLCRLYCVDPQYCLNADNPHHILGLPTEVLARYVHLYPSPDGNYPLLKQQK
jgi:hypothetical protein